MKPGRAGCRVEPGALAIRAEFAFSFLPLVPGFLDGIGPGAAVHIWQIKQFAKTAAGRAPARGGIVAEHLGVERREGAGTAGAGAFGGMDGELAGVIEGEEAAAAKFEGVVH